MRIKDKIDEIEGYLNELQEIIPNSFRQYKHYLKTRAACERYFEKIIESVTDLAFLLIKDLGTTIPEGDKEAFDVLAKEEVISDKLASKLKDAKGMRNILAHEYGEVDDEIVFESITKELYKDVKEFLKAVKKK